MLEIHPFLNLSKEDYKLMDKDDRNNFLVSMSNILRLKFVEEDFERIKYLIKKIAVEEVEKQLKIDKRFAKLTK
jgi:hypothetical protein